MNTIRNKLKKIFETEEYKKYNYVGNCVNSFDEDGESVIPCFNDTSDFAYQEENAKIISKEDFLRNVNDFSILSNIDNVKLSISENGNVIFAYDPKYDVHYFFVK